MVKQISLRRVGGSVNATLPKDMLDRIHVRAGDTMYAIETRSGILLTPYDPGVEKGLQAYEKFVRRYRNALKELAQS